jgi:hypothetical protein
VPARLRAAADKLPYRLGLTSAPDGGWGDFVRLHPNRELPVYAAQAAGGGLAIPQTDIYRFLRAHHYGGFTWLLRDRIEDGQVAGDHELFELADAFERRWRQALGDAMGDAAFADTLCRRAAARWWRGTRAERRVLTAGSLRSPIYAAVVREKLGWIGTSAQALLLIAGGRARMTAFLRAHDLFMLGLQAIDDVIDREQDAVLRGGDVPAALRCSPGALLRAAPLLVSGAARAASSGGFSWFAVWLDAFADALAAWRLEGDAIGDQLDAIGIAGEIEEAVLRATEAPFHAVAPARPPTFAAPA